MRPGFIFSLLALSSLVVPVSTACALPTFPDALKQATDAPCLPHCNVCHRDDGAGGQNVDRPFVLSMRRAGLGGSIRSLDRAVARLQTAGTDSDGDGVGDIDELAMGDDPNNSYDAGICGPQVGCAATQGTDSSGGALAWFACLAALVWRARASTSGRPRGAA